jgi:hypothetical protein
MASDQPREMRVLCVDNGLEFDLIAIARADFGGRRHSGMVSLAIGTFGWVASFAGVAAVAAARIVARKIR